MTDILTQSVVAISNWFHLLATVLWIGGMTTLDLIVTPSVQKTLSPPIIGKFISTFMKRFRSIVYFSIIAFLLSGLALTYFDDNFTGFFDLSTSWAIVSLIKHIVVVIFIIAAVYNFEVFSPKVAAESAKGPSQELTRLQNLQQRNAKLGLLIAIVVLILTGISLTL